MKICAAQTKAVKGDVQGNIDNHKRFIDLAAVAGAGMIIFPELSLTGYEPELAKELATNRDDERLNVFQKISDDERLTVGVGLPTKNDTGVCISMILFQPQQPRQIYSKKYLHSDEEPFFVGGQSSLGLIGGKSNIALAICYELSIPEHAQNAFESGAEIYIASAVKSVEGVEKAVERLSEIAGKYSMTVLMSNSVGQSDGIECGGKSSAWNNEGLLLGQLDDTNEGIIIIDTETHEVFEKTI